MEKDTNIAPGELSRDFGLGSRVVQKSKLRFLNRDGSFNVRRRGQSLLRSLNPYHTLLSIPWTKFFLAVVSSYFLTNIFFALGYLLCGPGALRGAEGTTFAERFLESFFFSVQTLSTIGYGRMDPHGLASNILVTFEVLIGLLGFALATGLLFARFSRPVAKIVYSENAIIAPYKGITALEFRIVNGRNNELISVEATVTLSMNVEVQGETVRKFYPLELERQSVIFFPLHWVIVHPITEKSPLYGRSRDFLESSDAEILILLTGVDETFAQIVHSRSSYKHHEIVWGAKFADIFHDGGDGMLSIDLRKLHDIELAELPV